MSEFKVGQRIETNTHRTGIVKYVGPIHVAEGAWLGIDLLEPMGKNDGSVRGERYFDCPPQHGLFVKETDILQILSQPVPKAAAPKAAAPKPKAPTPAPRSRPSSTVAPKSTSSRPSSVTSPPAVSRAPSHTKRQSVAPVAPRTPLRAPTRKPSVANASTVAPSPPPTRPSVVSKPSTSSVSSVSQPQNPLRTSTRDSNVDALQTKIKHMEKQHSEDQARLKELSQAESERDKYQGIMQKLQTKLQAYHQESKDAKAELEKLMEENKQLSKDAQDHEFDLEDALLEREMAQERADQNEAELEGLRAKAEQQDLELEILKDEAEAFTAHMSEEDKEQAGYYRLQHENDRLREALITLKEITEDEAQNSKIRIDELEEDSTQLEALRKEHDLLQQRLAESQGITEHLKAQVNDRNELEDIVEEMSSKIQELESTMRDQEQAIEELESLKDLNEELLDQQDEAAKDLRAEYEAKEAELEQLGERALEQARTISDLEETNTKFRDLVTELLTQIKEAEATKTMTEAQVKDTTGRINEIMDVNRRLRAAEVNATSKEITSELRQLKADQTTEMLEILSETQSQEFGRSEPMQAYFTAKRIMFKSNVLSGLLASADKHADHKGNVEEAASKLLSIEAGYYLANLSSGSNRISSAMAVSTLQQFATFSAAHAELVAVERNLDHGLEAIKADRVNFSELAKSFGGSIEVYKAVLSNHQPGLAERPEDETMLRISSIAASLSYLDATCTATITMLKSLAETSEELAEDAEDVVDRFAAPSAVCSQSMLAATRLLKTCNDRRGDGLYPQFNGDFDLIIEAEEYLTKVTHDAAEWSRSAIDELRRSIDADGTLVAPVSLKDLLLPFWSGQSSKLENLIASLNSWVEYALLLKDCVEIQHGPAPWTEKAKEIEATRRQVDEAAAKLQSITAEHQATLLRLHEREQVIETKELEIEHLAAKNREATNKSEDVQRLQDEITAAQTEIKQLQKQDKAQQQEISDLNTKLAHAAQYEPAESDNAPVVAAPGPEPADASSRSAPASLMSLLDALQIENHWLRQKNHSAAFGTKQVDLLKFMRPIEKREPSKLSAATESLLSLAWLTDDAALPETLSSISSRHGAETDAPRQTRRARHAPLALAPLQTQLDFLKNKGRLDFPGLDDTSFADLSPTLENFDSEILSLRPLRSIMV
ncbi:dynein associated protein-domain-containing protein [Boeremia exigua]|uniref:dynein associated protein-domain-containing protein n=1 Tax=Boeremia exigua TaxID=749465 RepID=UPI001E8DE151|nr:dynein associated protein-domain-containing protein [Boeremia exigua]KAH6618501.1 dynein associated protein-domain-containing protein [Boeremia exigua]